MNPKLRPSILVALVALLGAIAAQTAYASSAGVIRDCSADGVLNGHYSQGELQGALHGLPSDVDEYTDCRSVIRQATLTKAGGKGNPKASIGKVDPNVPTSPNEQRSVDNATKSATPVTIGGKQIRPGDSGFQAAAINSHIPSLLSAVLVMFAMAAIGGGALVLENRWPRAAHALASGATWPFRRLAGGARRGISRFRD